MKSRWIEYDGVSIFHCDFRDFGSNFEALRAEVHAADEEFLKRPPRSVLSIADLSGTQTSVDAVTLFIASAKRTRSSVRKQAVIGLTGVQRILAQSVAFASGQLLHIFDDEQSALRWLASGADGGIAMRP